jgi:hypothetical protein
VAVVPGDRVRVVDGFNRHPLVVGELVRLVGDSVTISTAANLGSSGTRTVWIVGGQRRLEVRSAGRDHTLIGALAGQLVGTMAAYAIAPHDNSAIAAGMVAGFVIGGIVGHRIKSDTWRRVDYCLVCVAIAPGIRGALLSASIAF